MCFGGWARSRFDVDDRIFTSEGLTYPLTRIGMRSFLMFSDGLYYSMYNEQIPHERVEGRYEKLV